MADKDKLRNMLDAIVDDNNDQAQVDFHGYLENKMREIINPAEEVKDDDDTE